MARVVGVRREGTASAIKEGVNKRRPAYAPPDIIETKNGEMRLQFPNNPIPLRPGITYVPTTEQEEGKARLCKRQGWQLNLVVAVAQCTGSGRHIGTIIC